MTSIATDQLINTQYKSCVQLYVLFVLRTHMIMVLSQN